jgi:hypothetical protein
MDQSREDECGEEKKKERNSFYHNLYCLIARISKVDAHNYRARKSMGYSSLSRTWIISLKITGSKDHLKKFETVGLSRAELFLCRVVVYRS